MLQLLLLTTLALGPSAPNCTKVVFDHYCLGGAAPAKLMPTPPDADGLRSYYNVQPDGTSGPPRSATAEDDIFMGVYRGKVSYVGKVISIGANATSLRSSWGDYMRLLQAKYGPGTSSASIYNDETLEEAAIQLGLATRTHTWFQPDFFVVLAWVKGGVLLGYYDQGLSAERDQARQEGL